MPNFHDLAVSARNSLFRLALRITGDPGEAEDVVQEVMIKGWQNRSKITAMENPPAWLMRMTRNQAIDQLRSQQTRNNHEQMAATEDATERVTPLRLVEGADTLSQVHKMMRQLPEAQRTVLHLREIEGLTYDEIQAVTQLSAEQVKVYLHRGRSTLRQQLLRRQIIEK